MLSDHFASIVKVMEAATGLSEAEIVALEADEVVDRRIKYRARIYAEVASP